MPAALGSVRAYRPADFDALHALVRAAAAPGPGMTPTGLREHLDVPGVRPETDLFLVPDAAGTGLLGARDVRVTARGDEAVPILESWGVLQPAARGSGVPRALLRAALSRARGLVAERGRAQGIVQVRAAEDDAAAQALYESAGLRPARVLHTIVKPHLGDLKPAAVPNGIELRPYRHGIEAAWVEAFNDAFADHWGGFMGMPLAFWQHYVRRPWFKPAISLVAWDGDRIAGFGHFRIDDEMNALTGRRQAVMRYVGVRPPWRGRGLGVALTRAGLLAVRDAGMTAVASGVDSENVTGAHHIYAREGFVVTRRQIMYRSEIVAER